MVLPAGLTLTTVQLPIDWETLAPDTPWLDSTATAALAASGAGVFTPGLESTKVRVSSTATSTLSPIFVLVMLAAIGLTFSMRWVPSAEVMVKVRALVSTAAMRPAIV